MIIINPGDIVVLTDEESLKENIKEGIQLLIKKVTVIVEQAGSCSWQIIETDSDRILVIKSSRHTDAYDVKVMWESQELPKGNKIDWVKAGFNWLFLPPEDQEFTGQELIYTEEIFQNEDRFVQKSPTWYGTQSEEESDTFYAVHELASESAEYDEIIIFESGADNTDGGYITFLQGKNIPIHDIEVLTRSEE